jgi:CDP-diacylglycerol--glycerol-3-phosphate 3-phosphatidyltransferase
MTLARIPLAAIFALLQLTAPTGGSRYTIGLLLLILIEGTDALDGCAARYFKLQSEAGATLDPFADSLARLIVYWTLAEKGLVLHLVPLCMALRDVTVAYSRIVLAKKQLSVSAKLSGKIKAIFQAAGAFAAFCSPLYVQSTGPLTIYVLSWIVITVTLLSSVEYVRSAVSALKS